jgi:serine protease Do
VGEWVMAVGNPYNYEHTVTVGVISAKDRKIEDNPFERYIQTDAAINYGNSGGPLFNAQGEVVAINCAISTKARGIGFSIPINHAKEIVRQLEQRGRVVRGYLGLGPDSITEEYASLLHLPSRQGVLVVEVSPDSAAAKSGIRRYDAITEINGKPILGRDDFFQMIAGTPPGTRIRLKGLRDQKGIEFDVVVRERQPVSEFQIVPTLPEETRSDPVNDASQNGLGIAVQEVSSEHRKLFHLEEGQGGVLIVSITPFGPAADAGLTQGEVILEINRLPVRSLSDYQRVISQCKREEVLIFLVSRPNTATRLVTVHVARNQP